MPRSTEFIALVKLVHTKRHKLYSINKEIKKVGFNDKELLDSSTHALQDTSNAINDLYLYLLRKNKS